MFQFYQDSFDSFDSFDSEGQDIEGEYPEERVLNCAVRINTMELGDVCPREEEHEVSYVSHALWPRLSSTLSRSSWTL